MKGPVFGSVLPADVNGPGIGAIVFVSAGLVYVFGAASGDALDSSCVGLSYAGTSGSLDVSSFAFWEAIIMISGVREPGDGLGEEFSGAFSNTAAAPNTGAVSAGLVVAPNGEISVGLVLTPNGEGSVGLVAVPKGDGPPKTDAICVGSGSDPNAPAVSVFAPNGFAFSLASPNALPASFSSPKAGVGCS